MPGKPPYFRFYVDDFAADGVVESMTTEQVGAYILLLCKAWKEDPGGSIPDDDAILARWARTGAQHWSTIREGVLRAFVRQGDGRWHQKRMALEYQELVAILSKKSKGGKKGSRRRWDSYRSPNESANADPITTKRAFGSGSGSGSESGSGSGSGSSSGGGGAGAGAAAFERFWDAYPRKVKRQDALKSWRRLAPDAALVETIVSAVGRQKQSQQWVKDGGEYIPHPTTWLNQRRWEDQPPQAQTPSGEMDWTGLRKFVEAGHDPG